MTVQPMEELQQRPTTWRTKLSRIHSQLLSFVNNNRKWLHGSIWSTIIIAFHVYLGFAIAYSGSKTIPLLVVTAILWLFVASLKLSTFLSKSKLPSSLLNSKLQNLCFQSAFFGLFILAMIIFLIFDSSTNWIRLVGLAGYMIFIIILTILSKNPFKINWRLVVSGCCLQLFIGLLCLRCGWTSMIFMRISEMVADFLKFTYKGSDFVFGFLTSPPNICGLEPVFFFTILQVITFFSSVVGLLSYYNLLEPIVIRVSWPIHKMMCTSSPEALSATSSAFIGLLQSPFLLRHHLASMTSSQLTSTLTSGFSATAGYLFTAYTTSGACPNYLLAASLMSIPGSILCANMLYPHEDQSEEEETDIGEEITEQRQLFSPLHAVSNAAVESLEVVAMVAANMITFIAFTAFLNSIVMEMGLLIEFEGWSLQKLFGYISFPFIYLMGTTNLSDVEHVAELLGTKLVINEFVSYRNLGKLVMEEPRAMSDRAIVIATFALSSFSSIMAVGIQLAVVGTLSPKRKHLLTQLIGRALLGAWICSFMTAALAGVLIKDPQICQSTVQQKPCLDIDKLIHFNSTEI